MQREQEGEDRQPARVRHGRLPVCKALGVRLVVQPLPLPAPKLNQLKGIAKGARVSDYRELGERR